MTVFAIFAAVIFVFSPTQTAQVDTKQDRKATYQKFANADAVTRDIRKPDVELVRVEIRDPADHKLAAKYGKIINDYGSFVVIAKKPGANLSRSGLQTQPIERTVNLPGAKFDPLNEPPSGTIRAGAIEAASEKSYYIVQFGGIVNDEWLDSLRDVGVEFLQYVPHNAFYVYADRAAISKAAAHSRVRWTGAFLPEHKIHSVLNDQLNAAKSGKLPPSGISPLEMTGENKSIFDIAVFKRGDLERISNLVQTNYGGNVKAVIDLPGNYFNVVRAELSLDDVLRVTEIPGVITIDFYSKPRIEDERAAHIVSGNYTNATTISGPGYNPLTQFGANGANVTVSVVDDGISIPGNGGFYVTSANTVDALRGSTAGASGGHGHINASIIAGDAPFGILDPTGHNYGLGIAPKSHIINVPMLKAGYSGLESDAYNDTVATNGPNGVPGSISNNSWGNGTNSNVYDSYTAQFDGYVRDASAAGTIDPISLVFSAGNSGPGALSLTRPKAAKNVIATGNSENLRPELSAAANNMEDLTSSSSRGPAADGRVKPDITAPGTVITGGRAGNCTSVSSCFETNHAWSSGTSHAAPQIAGVAALFTQFWKNNNGGSNPSPALVKAAIINTATEMNGVNTGTAIPNGNEGWGRVFVRNMLNTGVAMKHVNQTTAFTDPGNSITYTGTVADASKPVRISLVWTDPPGAANANPALVNNLDLTVTIGANTYRGNVFTGGVSTTGGSADTINNVENIFLPAGIAAGTSFSIQVSATAINGDGILGNADATDQHFALVAYNFAEPVAAGRRAPFDYDGDDRTDLSIFRAGPGEWWYQRSSNGSVVAGQFGATTDRITPGDFTGDQKTDIAFWRPSTGQWFVLRSEDSSFFAFPFGTNGDVPVPSDYDADGRTDAAVFRPSENAWYILKSSNGGVDTFSFGTTGDKPVVGDYDGDNRADIAIYRPSNGQWWVRRSSDASIFVVAFGTSTDRPVQGYYTPDNKVDHAFWRPATGEWFVLRSEDFSFFAAPFGSNGDIPAPGDYDGDDRFDFAVFRPSQSAWYVQRSTSGILIQQFGISTDIPTPSAFVP